MQQKAVREFRDDELVVPVHYALSGNKPICDIKATLAEWREITSYIEQSSTRRAAGCRSLYPTIRLLAEVQDQIAEALKMVPQRAFCIQLTDFSAAGIAIYVTNVSAQILDVDLLTTRTPRQKRRWDILNRRDRWQVILNTLKGWQVRECFWRFMPNIHRWHLSLDLKRNSTWVKPGTVTVELRSMGHDDARWAPTVGHAVFATFYARIESLSHTYEFGPFDFSTYRKTLLKRNLPQTGFALRIEILEEPDEEREDTPPWYD